MRQISHLLFLINYFLFSCKIYFLRAFQPKLIMVDQPMGKPGNGFASRVRPMTNKFGKES